jgi:hypothetical protein
MARGGARNRSGPQADPKSLKSARLGLVLTALPREGYAGKAPEFPLPFMSLREEKVWLEAWRSPQAAAWALETWRHRTIAMWVRWSVRMESDDASASLGNVVVRFADQIGLTPAGLKENGWAIAPDVVTARRTTNAAPAKTSRNRLEVVQDASGV